jgi:hypothetical protein
MPETYVAKYFVVAVALILFLCLVIRITKPKWYTDENQTIVFILLIGVFWPVSFLIIVMHGILPRKNKEK